MSHDEPETEVDGLYEIAQAVNRLADILEEIRDVLTEGEEPPEPPKLGVV